MMLGIGNDIVEVKRIESIMSRHGKRFLDKIFTKTEQEYCLKYREPFRHFAGRFAAKEAIVKALGTGLRPGISWLDIEVVNDSNGKPQVFLSEKVNLLFQSPTLQVSISHCSEYAAAVAVRSS